LRSWAILSGTRVQVNGGRAVILLRPARLQRDHNSN
jgi:hypothetical protein